MKLKNIALTLSLVANIFLASNIGAGAGADAEQQPKIVEVPVEKVVEKIVEVPVEVPVEVEKIVEVEKVVEVPVEKECDHAFAHNKYILGKYEVDLNGKTYVEFSDYSYAVINHNEKEYIFQPSCMGDWYMEFETFEELKMAMETYFQGAEVTIQEPQKVEQDAESMILNPDAIPSIEKELAKVPTAIKKLLIENGVEIYIQEGYGENHQEGVYTYGSYYWSNNAIVMDATNNSIESALIHEIGHALDDFLNLRTEKILESYKNKEVYYDYDYYYSCIEEYIAQSIHKYYNGTLEKNTDMHRELDRILGTVK